MNAKRINQEGIGSLFNQYYFSPQTGIINVNITGRRIGLDKRLRFIRNSIIYLMVLTMISCSQTAIRVEAASKKSSGFIHTSGTKILDGNNKEFIAKGIAFGNDVWSNPSMPPVNHHTESSYKELSRMGFNSIRFYLNYGLFEEDKKPYQYKQSGWDWLDQNIAWAKKYNMKLILNMHYPQGGYQSNGDGMALWMTKENQNRLVALWKEIANRYKAEPAIMAYDLLNEPYVTELSTETNTFNQWKNLAGRIVTAIRKVDRNHMIIVERLNASKNTSNGQADWNPNRNGDMNFFLIKDNNIAYEFHIYEPIEFTHQNAGWIEVYKGKYSEYPDEAAVKTIGEVTWRGFTNTNPKLTQWATGWQYLQGVRFKINNPTFMFAQPTLQARNIGLGGSVWFDDITIKEYDENDKFVREINSYSYSNLQGWSLWQNGNSMGSGDFDQGEGHTEDGSLKISDTTDDANLSSYVDRVNLIQGHSYEISGYVLCRNVDPSSEIRIRLDFYSCDSVYTRNKEYLESVIGQYINFGKEHQVPLYLGEFGCISYAFQEDRGGDRFVADVLEICKDKGISFNYHAYHEESFGLYQNSAKKLPDLPNKQLMAVFNAKLK
jgi:endoglucanase